MWRDKAKYMLGRLAGWLAYWALTMLYCVSVLLFILFTIWLEPFLGIWPSLIISGVVVCAFMAWYQWRAKMND